MKIPLFCSTGTCTGAFPVGQFLVWIKLWQKLWLSDFKAFWVQIWLPFWICASKNDTLHLCQNSQWLAMKQGGILFYNFHIIAISNMMRQVFVKVFVLIYKWRMRQAVITINEIYLSIKPSWSFYECFSPWSQNFFESLL